MNSSPVGRPRSAGRRDLPDNLIPIQRKTSAGEVTYWYWRDPRDGKQKSLQCPNDRATAIRRARELNAIISRELADQVVGEISVNPAKRVAGTPFNAYAVHCLTLASERKLAVNTMKTRKSLTNAVAARFGDQALHTIGVPEVVALIKHYTDQGKNRYAQSIRSLLIDIWNDAKSEGLLPADHPNPATIARRPSAKVQRSRLTLDQFNTILQQAEKATRGEWVANSMLLALVTGQRREDLAIAQFKRGRDWQGAWDAYQLGDPHKFHPYPFMDDSHLWVVQQKTGALVKIPLSLRLDAIGMSVADVVDRCRSHIASRYLIHHTAAYGNAPLGSPVFKDTITRAFADARDETDLEWPGKTPPTFHELRSLSERLYQAQGVDTKSLLGHRHTRMTEVYNDPRQAEWVSI